MPIVASDIKLYLSGGAANSDPNASLGGAISSTVLVDNTLHNLFDKVTVAEALAGDTEYRAIFIKNTHASLTFENVVLSISSQTSSAQTSLQLALAQEAIGVSTIETVANENTAPSGETFAGTSVTIGNLAPGEMKGVWVKWVVDAGATVALDTTTIQFAGETNP